MPIRQFYSAEPSGISPVESLLQFSYNVNTPMQFNAKFEAVKMKKKIIFYIFFFFLSFQKVRIHGLF